jgi:propanol-preferring alcohol dehydrogenase
MAVQILRATSSARVVAVDVRDTARALALQYGADLSLSPGPDLAQQIREFTAGVGADLVIDCVGSDDTLAAAAACARQLGDITIVGIAGGTLPVSFFGVPYEVSVQTTYWGNRRELVEVLDLASRGLLTAETTPHRHTETWPTARSTAAPLSSRPIPTAHERRGDRHEDRGRV